MTAQGVRQREFHFTILGRTLEHLGSQMYKRRDTAIAELVANCWDAGATVVDVTVPDPKAYAPSTSVIEVVDDGAGMDDEAVENEYLVVGRNRRADGQPAPAQRAVMGRKGIGKLAGFGIASEMLLSTWRDGEQTTVALELARLKVKAGEAQSVPLDGVIGPADATTPSGTRIRLTNLKHKTAIDPSDLRESLARRFSGTVRGHMTIRVNGETVTEPEFDLTERYPAGTDDGSPALAEEKLDDGTVVRYWYGFSKTTLASTRLRGFTVLVNGKTAQAPPFFFFVEGTASGQHGTKSLTGVIEADFLDAGTDDESDIVSTDRQELDWEDERTTPLREWGDKLTRRLLREHAARRAAELKTFVIEDPELNQRIGRLDGESQKQIDKLLFTLGQADADKERWKDMASQLIAAYEYRHFHEAIDSIEAVSDDPEQLTTLLEHLQAWRTLESRAILAVIEGRLQIVDKFHTMIVNDAPETTHSIGKDNLHDLLADYPWLLQPDWQVLYEERAITTQLREWNAEDVADEGDRTRFDFLALADPTRLVVIEIKRAGHPPTLEELTRLITYMSKLSRARPSVHGVFVSSDQFADNVEQFRKHEDLDLWTWDEVHSRVAAYYRHYRGVLSGETDDPDFAAREREVRRTREVLDTAAYRGPDERRCGVGESFVDHRSEGNAYDSQTTATDPS